VEHPPEFEVGDGALELRDVGLDREQRGVVGLGAREIVELAAIVESGLQSGQRMDDAVELLLLLPELLRPLRVVPDLRILELAVDGREPRRPHIEVKDTSEAERYGPSGPSARWRSHSDVRLPWPGSEDWQRIV
jgi:hypothetical protein